jgi:cell wall-associated NlpC family hydrolase
MTLDEVRSYLGKPYVAGADGPDAFDCRGLVCWILRHHFSRDVPNLPIGPQLGDLWSESITSGAWETVDLPKHGDAVVLRGGADPHVGVYLEVPSPGVLHAWEGVGQVVWTPIDRLRFAGFSRRTFVRCHVAMAESPTDS